MVGGNGEGKSTFADAICFALYGKPFRKIKKDRLVNSINVNNMVVEILFKVGNREYRVIRGIRPQVFDIYLDGKLIPQDASVRDYQEHFEKNILKMNFKSFTQVVILGSASYVPFMELSTSHRRDVIGDLLDVEIFSVMNVLLKEQISDTKKDRTEIESTIKTTIASIRLTDKHINTIETINMRQTSDIERKIMYAESQIKLHKERNVVSYDKSVILHEQMLSIDGLNSESNKLRTIESKLIDKKARLEDEIEFYEDNDDCSECGQKINEDFSHHNIVDRTKEIDNTNDLLVRLTKKIEIIRLQTKKANQTQKAINEIDNLMSRGNAQISTYENGIKVLRKELSTDNFKDVTEDKESLAVLREQQRILDDRLSQNSINMQTMKHASLLLKDGGIKARIIKQYIPIMNQLINQNLAALEFFCQFNLDENFNETIKSRHRDNFSYHSFSEGEKTRINISLLFAWRAIAKLRNSVSTNLLIMDEILDSSLDVEGTTNFIRLLKKMTADTNVFIISHKTDNIIDKFDRVLKVSKVKNFSRIGPYEQ